MMGETVLHAVVSDIVLAALDVAEGKRPRAETLQERFSNENMETLYATRPEDGKTICSVGTLIMRSLSRHSNKDVWCYTSFS